MYLAVDIGGTKTLLAVFDSTGKIKAQKKFPTPTDYSNFVTNLANSVADFSTSKYRGVVVAVPATLDRKNGVAKAFGNLEWENVPIRDDIQSVVKSKVILENDAKLAALSEALAYPRYKKVLYITVSTGIGGGLIINGKIDPQFADMEIGQMLLEYEGKLTDWEDFASGRAFQAKFGHKVSETAKDDTEAWYWLARNLAIGLIDVIANLTPEIIIIGGGVGAHFEMFQDRLLEELEIYENPLLTIPPILKAKHAEEAVIYGCYELARRHYGPTT